MTRNKCTFQCGKCNLIEEGLTQDEVIELSGYHYSGKHIDKDELRKIKKLNKCKVEKSKGTGGKDE